MLQETNTPNASAPAKHGAQIAYIQIKNPNGGGCGTDGKEDSRLQFWDSRNAESDMVEVSAKLARSAPTLLEQNKALREALDAIHRGCLTSDIGKVTREKLEKAIGLICDVALHALVQNQEVK